MIRTDIHRPDVRVGSICADKIGMGYDHRAFNVFQQGMKDARLRKARLEAETILNDKGLARSWAIYNDTNYTGQSRAASIIQDIVGKFVRYGSLSDKQFTLLAKLEGDIDTEAARKAQWAAQDEARRSASTHVGTIGERRTFTATIRFSKFIETDNSFGDGFTLTVLDDEAGNVLVWTGTGFGEPKGSKITFKGTIKAHTERDGVKQTKINRCALLKICNGPIASK